ncbi:hypothetical protein [Ruegeria lacuscaerulensis]|uniref:hypothetical protein n=1 Tax=Ruegeria lacuscaerulensis TaxID=55218 RepID=UPI00147E1732|nr:hypothetical protein [Ruegeria lacuscaerulensis]
MEKTGRVEPLIETELVRLYHQIRATLHSDENGSLDLALADRDREHIKQDMLNALKTAEKGLKAIFHDCKIEHGKHR